MSRITRIVVLHDEVEAMHMAAELERRGIPHVIRSFHDSAYDGLFQMQIGWGALEADEKHREEIEEIYADLRSGGSASSDAALDDR
jgi:hypothetical protein